MMDEQSPTACRTPIAKVDRSSWMPGTLQLRRISDLGSLASNMLIDFKLLNLYISTLLKYEFAVRA